MEKINHQGGHPASSFLVLGGGLAGIAAAVRLAEHGQSVTLVELCKRLGGRATSFVDPSTGQVLDNCQHVVMACCTNLLDLYGRLGVRDMIQWHRRMYFQDAAGRLDTLEADDLSAPLHLARSVLAFQSLSMDEKLAIGRGMAAMMLAGREGRTAWESRTFADWLKTHRQPAGAVEKFWSVVVVSAINELPQRMTAAAAMQVFQEGFLANEDAYLMGLPGVPLVKLYDQAHRTIEAAGGRVMLSTSAEALRFQGGRLRALRIDGGRELPAEVFVSALPFDRLAKILDPAMPATDQRLRGLDRIGVSPIIGIHLWMECPSDRPVMTLPHLVLTQSPLQWVFNKGYDPQAGGQHLHGVISAAHGLVDRPAEEIIGLVTAEIRRALPGAGGTKVLHSRVVKEKRATLSLAPGVEKLRPAARGPIQNLYLAGDWCATGWPATMEGAVRSGYLAAGAALTDRTGRAVDLLLPDLSPSALYRLVSR